MSDNRRSTENTVKEKPAASAAAVPSGDPPEKNKELYDRKKIEARDRRERLQGAAQLQIDQVRRELTVGAGPEFSRILASSPEQELRFEKRELLSRKDSLQRYVSNVKLPEERRCLFRHQIAIIDERLAQIDAILLPGGYRG
jgi:hypothetical protein